MSTTDDEEISSVGKIVERIKKLLNESEDQAVAGVLGVSPSAVSQWRSRGTVPWRSLVEWGIRSGINLNWLFTGVGGVYLDDGIREHRGAYDPTVEPRPIGLERELFGRVVERIAQLSGDALRPREIGELAVDLYQDVIEWPKEQRVQALRSISKYLTPDSARRAIERKR